VPRPPAAGRLVLVRHAKSDYPWGVGDHDRPLNPRGLRDAPAIGRWLGTAVEWDAGCPPEVRVSTARRAQATWDAASSVLPAAWAAAHVVDDERVYEADVPTLLKVVTEAADRSDLVVVVGHNPGLVELIAHLAEDDDRSRAALAKFPTSAIAVLDAVGPLADGLVDGMRVSGFAVPRGAAPQA
jgi:phosphohistidine phosphatase